MTRRSVDAVGLIALAAVAYLPALLSSPGRMPADTKLYLYLDPGGLVSRSVSTFEPDQFAGWVPHQQITYLWPSGPWFWLFDTIGVPDWIAHRLWVGTIVFLAGAGVVWAVRRLGILGIAGYAAGFTYALSPFLLAYVSRTSLLLLPWAGLGWIVGLTVRATTHPAAIGTTTLAPPRTWLRRLLPWRDPALIALVVATVGSANATALAMVIPAPALWILHVTVGRRFGVRAALALAGRVAVCCVAVSLWWVAMLVVQSRYGAPVLSYSETLEDVSRNSTGSEVIRSLGYWLFYQRDPYGPTTTASLPYLVSTWAILASFAVVGVGLAGIAVVRFAHRRYAAWLVAAGAIIAVGVHPYDSSSPLMTLLTADDGTDLALALRSSTRAVPVLLLGVAVGVASLVSACARRGTLSFGGTRRRSFAVPLRAGVAAAIGLLAVYNLPVLRQTAFVDPMLERDEDPPTWWYEAATEIDARSGDGRVLQLPGAEFGAFRWGYTADQPLVALADTPLVTRDLLPLGSAAAMDLLYALDDRFQEGTIEPGAIAPVARLLGATTVLTTNDIQFDRYRTARPEIVDDLLTTRTDGLTDVARFGGEQVNVPAVPMIDPTSLTDDRVGAAIQPLTVLDVADGVPVERAKTRSVVVSGSGDGIVDAATAGLLDGSELVRYSASLDGDELVDALANADQLIVTDSNRDRAHHWRGSQDVVGHTEPGGPGDDVLRATAADQRLQVFDTEDPSTQTVAVQDGAVTAVATAYGEPFAYRPEDRAVMAIDGDLATAWRVADHGDPVGESIRLTLTEPLESSLTLHQVAPPPGGRVIASVDVIVDGEERFGLPLDEASWGAGQVVDDPILAGARSVELEITAVTDGDPSLAASRAGVGFAEIETGFAPTTEWIRVPVDAIDHASDSAVSIVLTRLRTDPLDPWRSDPEPELRRLVELPGDRRMETTLTLRLDARSGDAELQALLGGADPDVPLASSRLVGAPSARGRAVVDGDATTSWITPFDGAIGASLDLTLGSGPTMTILQPAGDFSTITEITVSDGTDRAVVTVPAPDADGASVVSLPPQFAGRPGSLTISAIEPRFTIDRRYGDRMTLPAAIAELRAPGLGAPPPERFVTDECVDDLLTIDGVPMSFSLSGTVDELLAGEPVEAVSCDGPIELAAGRHEVAAANTGALTVDRVVLTEGAAAPSPAPVPDVAVVNDGSRSRQLSVGPCPDGCWFVHGEGFNEAWSASADGVDLGPPTLVDGGFNGWLLPPSASPTAVTVRWTAQGPVTWGLALSAVSALGLAAIVVLTRHRRETPTGSDAVTPTAATTPAWWGSPTRRTRIQWLLDATVLAVISGLLIAPSWAVVAGVVGVVATILDGTLQRWWTARSFELIGLVLVGVVAVRVALIERQDAPYPNAGWTTFFESLNGLSLFAVVLIAVGATRPTADPASSGIGEGSACR